MLKYIVCPKKARNGLYRITCNTPEKAESTRKTQEVLTGVAWEVVEQK